MSSDKQMLSVAEVFELEPGDPTNATWINPGMRAVVISIEKKMTKTNKPFWACVLGNEEGGVTVACSFFTAPKFSEGAVIELSGQGLRRTEYNSFAQVAVGPKTEVHIISSGGGTTQRPVASAAQNASNHADPGPPAVAAGGEGEPKWINGQTVGMAMKEAIAMAGMAWNGITGAALADPLFWADVKTYAGNIIRISRSLERGKLSPPSWPVAKREPEPVKPARSAGFYQPPKPATPPPRRDPDPTDGEAFDEEIPF